MVVHEFVAPGSRVVIQTATWRDLPALRHLEKVCFPKDAWPLLDLIGVLTFPNILRLKAVHGDHMVGFIACDLRPAEDLAWIATIGVLPPYRRQGIGRALLNAAEQALSVRWVRLNVRLGNMAAIHLYEEMGYQRAGLWPAYYSDGEDALIMEKRL